MIYLINVTFTVNLCRLCLRNGYSLDTHFVLLNCNSVIPFVRSVNISENYTPPPLCGWQLIGVSGMRKNTMIELFNSSLMFILW